MTFNHTKHLDYRIISENKLPERNFYCPKSKGDPADPYKNGSRITLLNGEWDFSFYQAGEQFDGSKAWTGIKVPSCYECFGFGHPGYVNDHYLFDIDLPKVPESDYGVYRKTFAFKKKEGKRYHIDFEGKDSCLYLYVNGVYVGFDSVSHCTSEFDITDVLKDGINEVLVFVYEACVGSYLECQDKFRLSGLFRDVYILERDEKGVWSYKTTYFFKKNQAIVNIAFADKNVKALSVYDGEEIVAESDGSETMGFVLDEPKLWNAEQPNVYLLKIECGEEVISDYLALRFVSLESGILKLNGRPIKITGTNHHDSKYETGYYLSLEDYRKDFLMMKEANMNGIRTSHYPQAPEAMLLMEEMGFYVIDEADVEAHGSVWLSGNYDTKDFDCVTDDPRFHEMVLDRAKRLYCRDLNRGCVIMWSAGNEAGYGHCIIDAIKWFEDEDKTRLVHYENIYTAHPERNDYKLKFASGMYWSIDKMKDFLKSDPRGVIQCEYTHAMGNSNGDVNDYVDYFYEEPRAMGGFVWEWNDHLFPIGLDKSKPGYGGDHGEPLHSGDFCVDGLITYKREVSTNLREVAAAYRKAVIRKRGDGYCLENRFDFTSLTGASVVDSDGFRLELTTPIGPHESVRVTGIDGKDHQFTLSCDQCPSGTFAFIEEKRPQVAFMNSAKASGLTISNGVLEATIDPKTGLIATLRKNGEDIIEGSSLQVMRAPIDNDNYEVGPWREQGLFDAKPTLTSSEVVDGAIVCKVALSDCVTTTLTYGIDGGKLFIKSEAKVAEKVKYLPRFGLSFTFAKDYTDYTYKGFGPYESYCDKHNLDSYGDFVDAVVEELPYIKPQECLSHLSESLTIKGKGHEIAIKGMNSFSFLPFSVDELMGAKHTWELKGKSKANTLSLDYMMSGVGTHACGPELEERFKLTEKEFSFVISMEVR